MQGRVEVLVAQARIGIYVLVDRLGEPLDLLIQPIEMAGDALADGGTGHPQAVGLLGAHRLQGIEAQYPAALGLLGRGGDRPGGGAALKVRVRQSRYLAHFCVNVR